VDPARPIPSLTLDLQAIAKEPDLLSDSGLLWSDDDVPLHERGVELSWLSDFVWTVYRDWHRVLEKHESQTRASNYFDWVPEPGPLPFPPGQEMTPEFLVRDVIRPLSRGPVSPLYALVPHECRGRPDLFVSHPWSNHLVGNAFATLQALISPLRERGPVKFVWLDVVSYNQHHVEGIAADMKAVVAAIGRVGIPMINAVPFSRLWCLWELLCAHVAQAEVAVFEPSGSAYDIGYVARVFQDEWESVERAATTLPADREQILGAMVSTFGSVAKADEHVRQLVSSMLSKDSDKPWKRPR